MALHSPAAIRGNLVSYLTKHTYPAPPEPNEFGTSQFVELAHGRWRRYTEGREPLPSMAYFIYTILQDMAGGTRPGMGAAAKPRCSTHRPSNP